MEAVTLTLLFSSFIAGLLTFLAPCTLPLVPAYLGFISGVSEKDLEDPQKRKRAKRKVVSNGVFFILGFSTVFIIFGALFSSLVEILQLVGIGPTTLEGEATLRLRMGQIGGVLVMLFGAFMLGLFDIDFLKKEKRMKMPSFVEVGKPASSLLIGGAFAFGWTPCVGPILGSILLLASSEGSVLAGVVLLAAFSLGLAIPFLLIALSFAHAHSRISAFMQFLSTHRVAILGVLGLLFGLLLDLVIVSVAALVGFTLAPALLSFPQFLGVPILSGVLLAYLGYKKPSIDVLSTAGGLFLVALGALLALNSFGLLVQYGFALFGSGFEELLFDYL